METKYKEGDIIYVKVDGKTSSRYKGFISKVIYDDLGTIRYFVHAYSAFISGYYTSKDLVPFTDMSKSIYGG